MKNLRPLGDRVLIKLIKPENKTEAGIILPSETNQTIRLGVIIAVGPGKRNPQGKLIPMRVKENETVYLAKYSGTELDNDHLIIREDEIIGRTSSDID